MSLYKNIITMLVIFFVLSITAISCGEPPEKPESIQGDNYSYAIKYAEFKAKELISKNFAPGIAMAMIDDQSVVYEDVWGEANMETHEKVTLDHVFRMCSLSKIFVSLVIMKYHEDGIINIEDPVSKYLPDFEVKSRFPDNREITIKDILTHRSGISYGLARSVSVQSTPIHTIVTDILKDNFISYPPGYRYKYSNNAFEVLGALIEEVSGEDFPSFMKKNIFDFVGMNDSSFTMTDDIESRLAVGYDMKPGIQGQLSPMKEPFEVNYMVSGGLFSTIADMSNFVKFIFRTTEVNGEYFITPETLKSMFKDPYEDIEGRETQGLGWKLIELGDTETAVWHDGNLPGYGTVMLLIPDKKIGVLVFANSVYNAYTLAEDTLKLMLETKTGVIIDYNEDKVDVNPNIYNDYEGVYNFTYENMTIYAEEKRIKSNWRGLGFSKGKVLRANWMGLNFDLVPIENNRFKIKHRAVDMDQLFGKVYAQFDIEKDTPPQFNYNQSNIKISATGSNFVCNRAVQKEDTPELWKKFLGEYSIETNYDKNIGSSKVYIDDGVLVIKLKLNFFNTELKICVVPINKNEILITGSMLDGETIRVDDNGIMYFDGVMFVPKAD